MSAHPTARPTPGFLTLSTAREVGILLALSLLFPFLIHLIPVPEDARLGQRLLPIFYAPLLGVLWGRSRSAAVVAVLAPWLNWLLTQHPSPPSATLMSVELLAFTFTVATLRARVGLRWWISLPAYVIGRAATIILAALIPALIHQRSLLDWAATSTVQAFPGLAVLVLLTLLVQRFYPPTPA
ncbi:MAG: hypothetical protein JSS11_14760 [Verrucomicrobia bacterium]|nr:hypothetical protein [Verrucomicrobiota bacterium]